MSKRSGSSKRQRTEKITVRLTPAEYAKVTAAAAAAGMTPPAVLRSTFLASRQEPKSIPKYQRPAAMAVCLYCGAAPGQACRTARGGPAYFAHDLRKITAAGGHLSEFMYPVVHGSTPCASCGESMRHYAGKEIQWHRADCPEIKAEADR